MTNSTTAIIFCDYQVGILGMMPKEDRADAFLKASKEFRNGIDAIPEEKRPLVINVKVAFRQGHPEINPISQLMRVKQAGLLVDGTDSAAFIPEMEPRSAEVTVVKRGSSPFYSTDIDIVLRANGIRKVILLGVSTSNVILSTTLHAIERDYNVTVISDCVYDPEVVLHNTLLEFKFARSVDVEDSETVLKSLQ